MNWLDYILIFILASSALQSFRRGFARETISLCAAIAALMLGMWFYGTPGSLVRPLVGSDRLANLAGFLIVVMSVLLLGAIVGRIVKGFVRAVGLTFIDCLLGAVFGLVRGAVVIIALMTAFMAFGPRELTETTPSAVVHSQIAPYLMEASRIIVDAAPMELKTSFRQAYAQVKSEIQRIARPNENDDRDGDAGKK